MMKQQLKEVTKDEFALDAIEIIAAPPPPKKKPLYPFAMIWAVHIFLPVDGLVTLRGCPLKWLCRYAAREIWFLHFNAF